MAIRIAAPPVVSITLFSSVSSALSERARLMLYLYMYHLAHIIGKMPKMGIAKHFAYSMI
jgi:hypothetical protein